MNTVQAINQPSDEKPGPLAMLNDADFVEVDRTEAALQHGDGGVNGITPETRA